jgi:hypothetical protein
MVTERQELSLVAWREKTSNGMLVSESFVLHLEAWNTRGMRNDFHGNNGV